MIKGLSKYLFSEKLGWCEWNPKWLLGLGWLTYSVVDNAGSITLWVTEEKLDEIPVTSEQFKETVKLPIVRGVFKLGYLGSYGNSEGKGYLCWDYDGKEYKMKEEFNSYEEGFSLLDSRLTDLFDKEYQIKN